MIVTIITSLAASVVLTHVVRRLAIRHEFVDSPDGVCRLHAAPVALGGGIALVVAFLGSMIAVHLFSHVWLPRAYDLDNRLWITIAAGAVIAGVGFADDRRAMTAKVKLLGQLVAATILVTGGIVVHQIQLGEMQIELGMFAVPLTIFGLVAAMNAMNLLDGADGAASSISAVILLTLACLATILGKPQIALLSILFANAVLGLLWHNVPPARIYLGDAGSMFLGLMLGSLTILVVNGSEGLTLYPALAIWTIPVLDTACAILRRWLSHRSIFKSDRAHIHHRLRSFLGNDFAVIACLIACCAIASASAVASVWLQNDLIALAGFLAVPTALVAGGVFGHVEIGLLAERAVGFRRSSQPTSAPLVPTNGKTIIHVPEPSDGKLGIKVPKTTSSANVERDSTWRCTDSVS